MRKKVAINKSPSRRDFFFIYLYKKLLWLALEQFLSWLNYNYYNYKDLFTHKDINTYINGVV